MRPSKRFFAAMILASALAGIAAAQTTSNPVTTVAQAIDRIVARENDENAVIRRYSPIVETYVQDMKADPQMGIVPFHDHYYLGQADLSNGVVDNSMLEKKKKGKIEEINPLAHGGGSPGS